MSLFKTEEFWSVRCGVNEKFTNSTLCVSNFLSHENKSDQIICGSLNGLLRMYSQVGKLSDTTMSSDGDTNPFSMINSQNEIELCMEYNIRYPVLQMSTGKFIVDQNISIAVLTPQKLILLIIDEPTMTFKVMEEFSLQRIAYNFCYGNFGRISDRDFVCVQSNDGTLSFYVNGHLSFVSYLASSLLPGPLVYLAQDDSVMIVSGERFLEGYKYKNLAVATGSGPSASQKRATPDWTINIGENAIDISVCDSPKDGSLVLVLTRYSFFIINNNSGVVLKKRFETRLKSLLAYGWNDGPRLLVTNCLGELMVFAGTKLKWKAYVAVNENLAAVTLAKVNDLSNFVVTLSEDGRLAVVFLGTDPSLGAIVTAGVRESTRDHDAELNGLQQRIKAATTSANNGGLRLRAKETRPSSLRLVVDHGSASFVPSSEYVVDLRIRATTDISNVLVRVAVRCPLVARQTMFHFPSLSADRDVVVSLSVHPGPAMVVCSLRANIYATYESAADNRLAVTQTSFTLPLGLVTAMCAPQKTATYKVTVDSGEPTVALRQLFPDLAGPAASASATTDAALGLQYCQDGPIVTVLASGTSTRYRLQSDNFEALWLIADELRRRLSEHFRSPSFRLRCDDPVPLDAYFLVLDFHHSVRDNLRQYGQMLEQRSRQFRAMERLLLARAKDKAQASLQGLDALLENCLGQLGHIADLVQEQQHHLAVVGNALCSATSLVGHLLQLSVPGSDDDGDRRRLLLEVALSGQWRDFPDMGLEELYGHLYGHLLRQVLGPGSAPAAVAPLSGPTVQFPDNLDKLKKHITVLCDRITRGAIVTIPETVGASAVRDRRQTGDDDDKDEDDGNLTFVHSPRVAATAAGRGKRPKKKPNKVDLLE